MITDNTSLADSVFSGMIDRVHSGQWKPGTVLPSQRELTREFGVSGVPLREALSIMKALGLLDVRQGRKTVVRQLDTQVIQRLFPLMFCLEGQRGFEQIYDLRLTVEPRSASLAAERRSQEDVDRLAGYVAQLHDHAVDDCDPVFFDADMAFHVAIAEATGNAFFALLQKMLAGYVRQAQQRGCDHDAARRRRAVLSHESIFDAIATRDARRASVEMEAHLRYSATHYFAAASAD